MDYYVAIVKEGHEFDAVVGIEQLGYVAVCFRLSEMRNLKHKKSVVPTLVEFPRWPGYVFVGMETDVWSELKKVDEVLGVIGVAGYPCRMREWQFDRMRREIEGKSNDMGVAKAFNDGDRVEIAAGQFTGLDGIFRNKNVELVLFGKRVKYRIDEEFLIKLY